MLNLQGIVFNFRCECSKFFVFLRGVKWSSLAQRWLIKRPYPHGHSGHVMAKDVAQTPQDKESNNSKARRANCNLVSSSTAKAAARLFFWPTATLLWAGRTPLLVLVLPFRDSGVTAFFMLRPSWILPLFGSWSTLPAVDMISKTIYQQVLKLWASCAKMASISSF